MRNRQTFAIFPRAPFFSASCRLNWLSIDPVKIQFVAEGTVTYATAPDPRGSYLDTKHFMVIRDGKLWKVRTITEKEILAKDKKIRQPFDYVILIMQTYIKR